MFVRSIRVRNFRTFRDSGDVPFAQFTSFIGPNGAGKSTLMRGLDVFYNLHATLTTEDFHHRNTVEPVSVAVTFEYLNAEEAAHYGGMVSDGVLTVEKRFNYVEGGSKGQYFGSVRQHSGFGGIRARSGREKIKAYSALRQEARREYADLPVARSADAVEEALLAWEREHPEAVEWVSSPVPFFGARNVGGGSLDNYTRFVRIPAVREASVDGADTRGSALGDLMNILVREEVFQSPELVEFRRRAMEEFARIMGPAATRRMPELERRLQGRMRDLVPRSNVHLVLGEPKEPTFVLPEIRVELTEDDFRGSIEGKGHGLQRAFIIAILQELALVQAQRDASARRGAGAEAQGVDEDFRPDLILVIEEPELFQHPVRQKHFANVLRDLAGGRDAHDRPRVQVLITTHSPHFVSMRHFDDLRLVAKRAGEVGSMESTVTVGRCEEACKRFCDARGIAEPDVENFKDGLRSIVDPMVAEAFFADCAVVVEGAGDHAALTAALAAAGFDPIREGVPLVEAGGKCNMSRIKAVLDTLGIPVYLVFDCDGDNMKENDRRNNEKENRSLLRLCGKGDFDVFPATPLVEELFACFPHNLEVTMAGELTEYNFNDRRSAISSQRKTDGKSPVVYEILFAESYGAGHQSPTLDRIVEAIRSLHHVFHNPVVDLREIGSEFDGE